MTYRDDRAARAQRIDDLSARLAGLRSARRSLTTLDANERALVAQLDAMRKQTAPSVAALRTHLPMVDRIEIATPCNVPWDAMEGDAHKRFCGQCERDVFNVATMSREQISALLSCGDTPCIRLFRRADGTVLTADCPVGLRRKKRRRLAAAVTVSLAATASILGALAVYHREGLASGRVVEAHSIAPKATDPVIELGEPVAPAPPPSPEFHEMRGDMAAPIPDAPVTR